MKPRRVYISGPMRGYKDLNFPAFDEAAARGRDLGYEIVSPADLDRQRGVDVTQGGFSLEYMRRAAWVDFMAIVGRDPETPGVDAIAMMAGWEKSKGACGEKAIAEWIGLPVLDARTFEPFES